MMMVIIIGTQFYCVIKLGNLKALTDIHAGKWRTTRNSYTVDTNVISSSDTLETLEMMRLLTYFFLNLLSVYLLFKWSIYET